MQAEQSLNEMQGSAAGQSPLCTSGIAVNGRICSSPAFVTPHSGSEGWTEACVSCSPGPRYLGSAVYDASDGYVLLYGGHDGGLLSDTWKYQDGTWSEVCSSCTPGARYLASMVYDAADGYVLLYGGYNGGNLGDTWEYMGGTWKEVCSSCSSGPRYGASMVYDAADGYVLLYGGDNGAYLGDAWEYKNGTWAEVCSSCTPGTRYGESLAYDAADGYVLMYGGDSGGALGDAWEYNNGTWTEVCSSCTPGPRYGESLVYDAGDGYVLLYGGDSTGYLGDAWDYKNGTWNEVCSPCSPGTRYGASAVYDAAGGYVLLYGGTNGGTLEDAWEYKAASGTAIGWTEVCSTCTSGPRSDTPMVYDAGDGYVLLYGGLNSGVLGDTWEYKSGTWKEVCSPCSPGNRLDASMAYDAADGYVLLYGGFNSGNLADTWAYKGGKWTEICSSCSPGGRYSASMAYDAADGYVLLYGGYNGARLGDAWEYKNGTWAEVCSSCSPGPRDRASMVYDAADGYVLLYGGEDVAFIGDAWEYKNGTWTQVCSPCSPGSQDDTPIVYDAADGYVLLYGGWNGTTLGITWEYKNGTWTKICSLCSPGERDDALLVFDAADGYVLLYGGVNSTTLGDAWVYGSLLVANPVSPSSPAMDSGQQITLASNPAGGYPPYVSYQWYYSLTGGGSCTHGSAGATTSSYATSPATNTYYCYEITDNSGFNASSSWNLVTVNPVLTVGSVTPASMTIDSGQQVLLTANPTGGTNPLSYQWYSATDISGPLSCSSGTPIGTNSATLKDSPTTSTYYCYQVTDNAYSPASGTSSWVEATVNPTLAVGDVTPESPAIDNGQQIQLTANPTGGTDPLIYQWYSATDVSGPLSCSSGTALGTNSETLTESPLTTTYYCYQVTDSASSPVSLTSVWDEVTVNPTLTVGSATPTSPTIDSGQQIQLTANPTGGTDPLNYQWYSAADISGPLSCTSGTPVGTNSATLTEFPTVDTYYCYEVTDSAHSQVSLTSSWIEVTVSPTLIAGSVTPASLTIDNGQQILLTANPTGGTSPLSYQWYSATDIGGSLSCSSGTAIGTDSATLTNSPAVSTYYCYTVTDGAYFPASVASSWVDVTVNPTLMAGGVTPSTPTIDNGQQIQLTANPTGGSGPLVYQWYSATDISGPLSCTSGTPKGTNSATLTDSPTTSTYYCYQITDSASTPTIVASGWNLVTVAADPTVSVSPAGPLTYDVGQSAATLTATVAYLGLNTASIEWYLSANIDCGNAESINIGVSTPTYSPLTLLSVTTYYCVIVTDSGLSNYTSISNAVEFIVNADPSIASFTASPNSTDVGVSTTMKVSASGGTGALSYVYTGLPVGCMSTKKDSLTCTPTEAGTFTVRVFANDTFGVSADATLLLTVNPVIAISHFTASVNPTEVGITTTLTSAVIGGTMPYTYVYTGLPAGCGSSDTPSLSCKPSEFGTFAIRVFVNDSLRQSVSANLTLSILTAVTITSVSATPNPFDITGSTTLTVVASGGSAPYTYNYTGLPTGCTSTDAASMVCTPSVSGSFTVRIFATDSLGKSTYSTLSLTVNRVVTIYGFTASANTIFVGKSTTLTVSASGGTAPYTYTYSGLPAGCASSNSATLVCTPTASGTYTILVTVNDTVRVSATDYLSLTVKASSSPSPTYMGLSASTWYIIGGFWALAIVMFMLLLLAWVRRSRSGETTRVSVKNSTTEETGRDKTEEKVKDDKKERASKDAEEETEKPTSKPESE